MNSTDPNDNAPRSAELSTDYKSVLENLKTLISQAQTNALRAVNKELISLYWEIGRVIAEKQEEFGWGENVVERLAGDLRAAFPGVRGFSRRNLFYIRQFYLTYKESPKVQAMLAQLSWTHHLEILKCRTPEEREFHLKMTRKFGWSYRVLGNQIDARAYKRWLLG